MLRFDEDLEPEDYYEPTLCGTNNKHLFLCLGIEKGAQKYGR